MGTDKFDEGDLRALAKSVGVHYEWLEHGIDPKYLDPRLSQIESAVSEASSAYKGIDQTVSDVELKAKSLIQDLQSLLDVLEHLKGDSRKS